MDRITVFDSMKGLAILGVIMVHSGCSDMPGILGKIGGEGGSGVQIFFIISAFLMFSSLDKIRLNGKNTGRWLAKKLLTLLPLYYLAVLASIAVNGLRGGVLAGKL